MTKGTVVSVRLPDDVAIKMYEYAKAKELTVTWILQEGVKLIIERCTYRRGDPSPFIKTYWDSDCGVSVPSINPAAKCSCCGKAIVVME